MAWSEHYVTDSGTDTYANAANSGTPCSLATAIAGYAAGDRINVKAGTYPNTTTTITFATSGTGAAPVWVRGYNVTPGDLDDVPDGAASGPAITFTTGRFSVSGAHIILSSLNISGAQTTDAQARILTGGNVLMYRCRVECTSANANGAALAVYSNLNLVGCWFKANASATAVVSNINTSVTFGMVGCSVEGGGHGLNLPTLSTTAVVVWNSFDNVGGDACHTGAAVRLFFLGNTVDHPGSDGIESATTLPSVGLVVGNIFSECGGYGINNSTGANTDVLARCFNLFHSNTSGTESGFGDAPSFAQQTDSASPFTNAAAGDLSLVSTSNAKAHGPPGKFENQSYTSYLDIGAVQRQEAGGAGGVLVNPGMIGGWE